MPYRKIPSDLWLRNRRKYPWIADFLAELSLDEFHGQAHKPGWYADRFDTNRFVIRRLIAARARELAECENGAHISAQLAHASRTKPHSSPLENSATCEDSRTVTAQPRTPTARPAHGDIETETGNRDREEKSKRAASRPRRSGFPKDTSDLSQQLRGWLSEHGFSESQRDYAYEYVADWAKSNGKRKLDWAATVRGALREGWGLKGYVRPRPPEPERSNGEGSYEAAQQALDEEGQRMVAEAMAREKAAVERGKRRDQEMREKRRAREQGATNGGAR